MDKRNENKGEERGRKIFKKIFGSMKDFWGVCRIYKGKEKE